MRAAYPSFLSIVIVVSGAACGAERSHPSGVAPCDVSPPPVECESPCATDTECASGFYCGDAGTCTAECTRGAAQCADGQYCDDDGHCIDTIDPPPCPQVAVNLAAVIPTVWLVIDQSGSMDEDFNGVQRWRAVVDALVAPGTGVVTRLADRVVFGASLYTSDNGDAGGTCPMLQESVPVIDNFTAIDSLLRANGPSGDTPTSESIRAVAAEFPIQDPERPGPRIILLATDGNPDKCADADAHDAGSQAMSESAVVQAKTDGIQTFVLSVGDDVSANHLQRLADVGIGQPAGSGVGTPYVANNPGELAAAFDAIIGGVRTCEFALDGEVNLASQCDGTITLNGQALLCGVDWQLTSETTLELLGPACDTFLNDADVSLAAEFPCGAVIL